MPVGSWNIIIGLVTIVAGASGRFTLLFTNSSVALIVIGAVITLFGVYQFVRARKQS